MASRVLRCGRHPALVVQCGKQLPDRMPLVAEPEEGGQVAELFQRERGILGRIVAVDGVVEVGQQLGQRRARSHGVECEAVDVGDVGAEATGGFLDDLHGGAVGLRDDGDVATGQRHAWMAGERLGAQATGEPQDFLAFGLVEPLANQEAVSDEGVHGRLAAKKDGSSTG